MIKEIVEILVFRSAEKKDITAIQEMYLELVPDQHPKIADMEKSLQLIKKEGSGSDLIVVQLEDKVVATCQVVIYENLVRTPHKKAIIDSVVVKSEYRDKGIGYAMLDWTLKYLVDCGCSVILVAAAPHREKAMRIYKKLGFTQFGSSFVYKAPE